MMSEMIQLITNFTNQIAELQTQIRAMKESTRQDSVTNREQVNAVQTSTKISTKVNNELSGNRMARDGRGGGDDHDRDDDDDDDDDDAEQEEKRSPR